MTNATLTIALLTSAVPLIAITAVLAAAIHEAITDLRAGQGLRRNVLLLTLFGSLWTCAATTTALLTLTALTSIRLVL